jgi:hypothetical protein
MPPLIDYVEKRQGQLTKYRVKFSQQNFAAMGNAFG